MGLVRAVELGSAHLEEERMVGRERKGSPGWLGGGCKSAEDVCMMIGIAY